MRDALLVFGLPHRQHRIDHAPRARGAEHALRPVAALVPARDDELEQVDDMIRMQMREEHRVDRGTVAAGAEQPLRDAGAAIDQER